MRDYRLMVVTLAWQDGTRRTIASCNPADLVTVGVMAHGGKTPAEFEAAFKGKLVEEPQAPADMLRLAVSRSQN